MRWPRQAASRPLPRWDLLSTAATGCSAYNVGEVPGRDVRVDLHAGPHGRGHRDRVHVLALGRRRLGTEDLVEDGVEVRQELGRLERGLAEDEVDVAEAVGAVLDLAALDVLDGLA